MAAGKAPALVKYRPKSRYLGRVTRLEDVVVVAVAVRAPVHAADDRLAVGDQQLHVVDLMADVVDRIDALGDPQGVERGCRTAAGPHGRVRDHTHRDATCAG